MSSAVLDEIEISSEAPVSPRADTLAASVVLLLVMLRGTKLDRS